MPRGRSVNYVVLTAAQFTPGSRTTLRTPPPPTFDREYTPARSAVRHRPEAHWRNPSISVARSDSHGDDVMRGLNEENVQERREPTARLDLGPGPVGVIRPGLPPVESVVPRVDGPDSGVP